jgi:hypothetical protein
MPFKSEKQRRYLWKFEPQIAKRWTNEYGSHPVMTAYSQRRKKKKRKQGESLSTRG